MAAGDDVRRPAHRRRHRASRTPSARLGSRTPHGRSPGWKAYAWWLVDPVVLAYATGRPLPRLDHPNVEVGVREERPYVEFRVLDATPLPNADVEARLRETMLEGQLAPVAAALVATTGIGRRTLWRSVAEAVAYPLLQRRDPGTARHLLGALGLADLVEVVSPGRCVRRSCCQAIAVPGLGVCDSCPVQRRLLPAAAAG